jgi:fibronectin-binding autotransporter adhesin
MGSKITNTISMGITLGSGAYTSPLVITNTGEIYPTQSRQDGVQMSAGYLSNSGTIYGGPNGGSGIRISGGTLFNNGVISPGYGGHGYGILLEGGNVSNRGTITGNSDELAIFQEGGTLQNYGVIENLGNYGYGVQIDSGTLINDGTIYSKHNGVFIGGGSVLNDAFINGVSLDGGGLVNNGTIESVESRYGGSFTNADSIGSVHFGTGASRIIIDPGAVFSGPVQASGSASREVIELASGVNSGTITGVGSQFNDFGVIAIDAGALWTIEGNASGLASGQAITGFASGDTLILDGFSALGGTLVWAPARVSN